MLWVKICLCFLAASRSSQGISFQEQALDKLLKQFLPFPCRPALVNIERILPQARMDWDSLTVSGYSSGAMMAVQYHFAHSAEVKGAGILAGAPFGQFYKNPVAVPNGALRFIFGPLLVSPVPWIPKVVPALLPPIGTVAELKDLAEAFAGAGSIDPTLNLSGSRVHIFSGKLDSYVNNEYGARAAQLYTLFGADVKADLGRAIKHVLSTDNFPVLNLGLDCRSPILTLPGGLANCGFEYIFQMFSHVFGTSYVAPSSSSAEPTGTFHAFNQANLTASGNVEADSMGDRGYLYVPGRCRDPANTCKIHVALHGCVQNVFNDNACNFFATASGYLQVADSNDVVMVYPQASGAEFVYNASTAETRTTFACWDFFGGLNKEFLLKTGPQLASIRKIAAKVAGVTYP